MATNSREFDSDISREFSNDDDTSVWKDMEAEFAMFKNESNADKTIEELDLTRLNDAYKALAKTKGDAKEGRFD